MSWVQTSDMVITKNKTKVLCSTPEHHLESPSRDSDSDAASPVPFLCTQDGAEGETEVVWNYYTPKSEHKAVSHIKNTTPLSRKPKKIIKPKLIEKPVPKRKVNKYSQKKSELFQELLDLNKNLHELISKKPNKVTEKRASGSEDDIIHATCNVSEQSPKSDLRNSSRCLRKNLLSSKFSKPEPESALESDDSINECLIKASQMIEENILNCEPTPAKRACYNMVNKHQDALFRDDSMDAILNNIKIVSPHISKVRKSAAHNLDNDSFDSLVGNLDDSALERLTQMPVNTSGKTYKGKDDGWMIKEVIAHESPTSKSVFTRHNSMPESPVVSANKPSTSGMIFGRYNSMPYDQNASYVEGDSPIRCTPEEIKKKHQQAREKLMAKRLLPFTSTQQSQQLTQNLNAPVTCKNNKFKPRVPSNNNLVPTVATTIKPSTNTIREKVIKSNIEVTNPVNDIKFVIEKKRQEALMKLRRRQQQS